MKKIIFYVLILFNSSLLFGYDLRGYWGLNIITPEKINYANEIVSWGECKCFDIEDGFLIDISEDISFIKFNRWGKIVIDEITDFDNTIIIKFNWKNKPSYIEFKILNEYEIYINSINSYFNYPNGNNNRFFKIDGLNNYILYPIQGKIVKMKELTWCGSYLGILSQDLLVTIISVSNTSSIFDTPNKKELIIRVDEKDLINFNDDYYKKYGLERRDSFVYGEINLTDIILEDNFEIY